MSTPRQSPSAVRVNNAVEERDAPLTFSGYPALFLGLLLLVLAAFSVYNAFGRDAAGYFTMSWNGIGAGVGFVVAAIFAFSAIYSLQPNEAAVLTLFGSYVGTDRKSGLRATVPFFSNEHVSQRVRYHECAKLKVNDLIGNPIEIGAVVVWRVEDCAKAIFQIDDYKDFVGAQTESALRHIASTHPYDFDEAVTASEGKDAAGAPAVDVKKEVEKGRVLSLRESGEQVTDELVAELKTRLSVAGVTVDEARITHLAYAPEIAPVMLRRQQASAIVAARKQVVAGAVDIVKEALEKLKSDAAIDLDDERRAAMVSNLLVVLVSDKDATPIVNTGTLYG